MTKDLQQIKVSIEKAQREIDLIREYRTRLIADVVTGKVDVRHLAPPPGGHGSEAAPEGPGRRPGRRDTGGGRGSRLWRRVEDA